MRNLNNCRINVMVSNMDDAIDFYVHKLGLTLLNRYEDHYAEIKAADLVIGLHPNSETLVIGNNISIGLGVSHFDQTVKALESKGIECKVVKDGWIRLAHFQDIDGNELFLAENEK